mgnify:CR=1 FL=1
MEELKQKLIKYKEFNEENEKELRKFFTDFLEKINKLAFDLYKATKRENILTGVIQNILQEKIERAGINSNDYVISVEFQTKDEVQKFVEKYKDMFDVSIYQKDADYTFIRFNNLYMSEKFESSYQFLQKVYESLEKIAKELPVEPAEFLKNKYPELFKLLVKIKLSK